jgi:class 3 adenylate cyclase
VVIPDRRTLRASVLGGGGRITFQRAQPGVYLAATRSFAAQKKRDEMAEDHQQRRLATILAADVFGYSRLMAENEEYTLRTLKAYRGIIDRLISRHEGRIFSTAGDSVLAEFQSAVEAVRCAIAVQEELRVRNAEVDENHRMEFRIGVNVGDVLVDGDNLYGDGVNIAARLENIAPPGDIYISGSVFTLVKSKLSYSFEDMGLQSVKNLPEPVSAFRLTRTGATPVAKARKPFAPAQMKMAIVPVVLIAGIAAWVFTTSLRTGAPGGRPVSDAGTAFDGIWEFDLSGGQYCVIKSLTFPRRISEGVITTVDGKHVFGSIAKDGKFHFANPSAINEHVTVESQGTINGETGEGTYMGVGTPCRGSYRIRLVQRLSGMK